MSTEIKWYQMYKLAEDYYKRNGNLNVPPSYLTDNGIKLGRWINNMNNAHIGLGRCTISDNQIKMLEDIGMVWKKRITPSSWDANYELAKEFYHENGHLDIKMSYITLTNVKLGRWIYRMRTAYLQNDRDELTEDRIKKLEDIGMVFQKNMTLEAVLIRFLKEKSIDGITVPDLIDEIEDEIIMKKSFIYAGKALILELTVNQERFYGILKNYNIKASSPEIL